MPRNETPLNPPAGIIKAVGEAAEQYERQGYTRDQILRQPLFGEIVDLITRQLVLRPDTSEARHIAKLQVITELGKRR